MSDEQQQQQQQQHQQQQQQMQQQHKSSKEHSSSPPASNANVTPPQRQKSNIHEMRNQDFVSRLMAATPPYLYSAPVGPNNFFFSDMLRSLVQARTNENARNLQLQQTAALTRRPRKRSWSQQTPVQHRPAAYYDHLRTAAERKEHVATAVAAAAVELKPQLLSHNAGSLGAGLACGVAEKPLELTTNKPYFQIAQKYRSKLEESVKEELLAAKLPISVTKSPPEFETTATSGVQSALETNSADGGGCGADIDVALHDTPPAASLPPQDLVLPPPPPVWYPPLYPPYGIDPLHFFIDLRVSGHIYDRKKENVSPLANAENSCGNESETAQSLSLLPHKHRHGSAFTVPVPRSNEVKSSASTDAINLTSSAVGGCSGGGGVGIGGASKFADYTKYYDLGQEAKENLPTASNQLAKCSANYMLQHLPRLYSQFAARDIIAASNVAAVAAAAAVDDMDAGNNRFCADNADAKSEEADDADSDGRGSSAPPESGSGGTDFGHRERDIDVEIIDSIKYRTDGESSSRCTTPDESSITQID